MSHPDGVRGAHVWFVDLNGETYGPFNTQAAAWQCYDRLTGDPETPAEKRSAHWLRMSANGQ